MKLYKTPLYITGSIYTETNMEPKHSNDHVEWKIERRLIETLRKHLETRKLDLPDGIDTLNIVIDNIKCIDTSELTKERIKWGERKR